MQVIDISCYMSILMEALENKFGSFNDFGGSNLNIGSEGKSRDKSNPEKEPTKDSKKEKPISTVFTPS